MSSLTIRLVSMTIGAVLPALAACSPTAAEQRAFPDAAVDLPERSGNQTLVLAGGCFWGIEAVFEHVKGVKDVTSGYAGGTQATADYRVVSSGRTEHAESVRIVYDPAQVSFGQLLKVFFSVAHDPTQLNRQGPDVGPQYRSAIFFASADEQRAAEAYIEQIDAAKIYRTPIVTEVTPLKGYFLAESYHQDYAARNPQEPYIVFHDAPKVANLKKSFPQLYVAP